MAEPAESARLALGGSDVMVPSEPRIKGGEGIRVRAARGTILNAGFSVGFSFLGFLRGFGAAAFLTVGDYGVWGLLAVSLSTLLMLVQVGVDDRYIQQDDEDQQAAFQLAFTMQLALSGLFVVVIAAAMPLYALAYDSPEIVWPGWALALAMPAMAFQAPLWTFYREMDYLRQRTLQAFDPVVSLVVTIGLAVAGLGYWALVIGVICGAWAAALAAVRASPYPLRLHYRPGALRDYFGFSGPLFLSALSGVLVAQVPVLIVSRSDGIRAVAALAIAATISAYANRVDEIVTDTLYPAVCAVRDRADLLLESFLKSNRLALLWAMPVGLGSVLFAPDVVHYLLGDEWELAVFLVQVFGLAAAINQIGFNWTAYYRALGRTGPIARASVVMVVAVMGLAVPLLVWKGIDGFGVGMGLATLVYVGARLFYLRRLFPLRAVLVNCARGIAPALPAAALVLVLREALGAGERGVAQVVAELAVYLAVVVTATALSERELLAEVRGYLRRDSGASPVPAA